MNSLGLNPTFPIGNSFPIGTSLCYQSHDLTRLNEAINSDLRKLGTWLQGNKLSLNVAKSHSMPISTKQKHNILKSQNKALVLKIRVYSVNRGLTPLRPPKPVQARTTDRLRKYQTNFSLAALGVVSGIKCTKLSFVTVIPWVSMRGTFSPAMKYPRYP